MINGKDNNQLIMYTTQDGQTKIRVNIDPKHNTVWLTQAQMAELFQVDISGISRHISNIFEEGELPLESNLQNLQITDFKPTAHYSLDVIISVGYRVKSLRGTQFRVWATQVLHEYMQKGFAMNDEILKQAGGGNYFKELLERIRDIRSSEKVLYRQVLELFATSVDYNAKAETARKFFQVIQNKLFYATSRHTAAEIIAERADAEQPFMGLTAFKGIRPIKSEVVTAKNYLSEKELSALNLLVSSYFDMAEDMALQEKPMKMSDWVEQLDDLIKFRKRELLNNAGKVSHEQAETKALGEYEKYKDKPYEELTQVEKDFLSSIKETQKLIEKKVKK